MLRRTLLTAGAAALATSLAGCTPSASARASGSRLFPPDVSLDSLPAVTVPPQLPTGAPGVAKVPAPHTPVFGLPGSGNFMAWTVDDGYDDDTVHKYAQFAADTGIRLTFFFSGFVSTWARAEPILAPLVASGQVQLAEHTANHHDLTTLSDGQIQDELMSSNARINEIFGVDVRPYFRPPYGARDARTDAAAARVGYTTPVMWYGSLSDAGRITPAQSLSFARQWFGRQRIVIGHANYPAVTEVFDELVDIIIERELIPVTLNDIFSS